MIKKSSLGPAKVVIGILSIVVGLFLTLFGGIAFLFRSFGGTADLSILLSGFIFMFMGIWMVFDAFFEDVEVRINNLDELAVAFGRRTAKCPKCKGLVPMDAKFCMNCGKEIRRKSEE